MAKKVFKGRGKVYIDFAQNGTLLFIGNVSELTIGATEETNEITDFTTGAGGTYASASEITSVDVTMNVYDYLPNNIALGLFGSSSAHTGAAQSAESITCPLAMASQTEDVLVPTEYIVDTTVAPAITGLVEGTDFEGTGAGILFKAGGSAAAQAYSVDYTSKDSDVVEALTQSAKECKVVVDGLNVGESGEPTVVEIYKLKFGPAADVALIGEDFAQMTLAGKANQDASITTGGLSQYYRWSIA